MGDSQSQHHKSSFHFNYGDTVLFPTWVIHTKKEAFFSALVLVIIGILYQALKFIRVREGRKCPNLQCKRYILNKGHIIQTLLYVVQFVGGYFLMLAIMTFNLWLVIGGILGLGLGYFFFGWADEELCMAPYTIVHPISNCGLSVQLDCGYKGKEQELRPLSMADGGDAAEDGSIACRCGEAPT